MPWFIYSLAAGTIFYPGVALLTLAVLLASKRGGRARHLLIVLLILVAVLLIAISAAALPFWLYGIWSATLLAWLMASRTNSSRTATTLKYLLLGLIAGAALLESSYAIAPGPIAGRFGRLYVVGDSVSAGIGAEHGNTWPRLTAAKHHVQVIDLSRAGATLADARRKLVNTPLADGLMLLEIGGNDMLIHADLRVFTSDLESLIAEAQAPGRKLVMLELPLLPFDNAYGIAQRRSAREHGIVLIPKRLFVDVLRAPDATVDGIHLTASGQRRMEEMIWKVVGPSLSR